MPIGSKGYKDTLKALNEVTDIGKELQKNGVRFKQGGELPKFQDGGGFDIPKNGKKAKARNAQRAKARPQCKRRAKWQKSPEHPSQDGDGGVTFAWR